MAKAHFVKKARKDNRKAGIKKGDSYYWWAFRYGGKHYSKTPPKPSQLTQSNFWSQVLAVQESLEVLNGDSTADELTDARDTAISDLENLRDECQESLDNMPEGLQQGHAGEMLQERVDALEEAISNLEDVDCEVPDTTTGEDEDLDLIEWAGERANELLEATQNISCE